MSDAERVREKLDERDIGRAFDGRRGESNLERVAVEPDDLAPRRPRLDVNGESDAAFAVINPQGCHEAISVARGGGRCNRA
jgi:hypothetical protein